MANDKTKEEIIFELKHLVSSAVTSVTEKLAVIEKLKELEGWETGGFAERIDALEAQLKRLEDLVHSLVERVSILERPGKGSIGFG